MSLGDIPEEHEETYTLSENCPSSFDNFYKSDRDDQSGEPPIQHIFGLSRKSTLRKDRESGDSRFSTYMCSDNLNKAYVSNENSAYKSQNESGVLKPKNRYAHFPYFICLPLVKIQIIIKCKIKFFV